MSISRPAHSRTQSDADWYIVEQHEANPLLDLGAQTRISVVDTINGSSSGATGDEEFSLVETARPSFAQVVALKSARSSVNPSPIASPILRVSALPTSATKNNLLVQQKHGSDYTLKKSGKKYVVTKA